MWFYAQTRNQRDGQAGRRYRAKRAELIRRQNGGTWAEKNPLD